jgi:glycosyltransferase involved in cell wall biosynthesis
MPRQLKSLLLVVVGAITLIGFLGFLLWATLENTRRVGRIVNDLASAWDVQLQREKARQEVISLRIGNELNAFFWNDLLKGLGVVVPSFGALLGALFALNRYLGEREKERLDRAAADLKVTLGYLASDKPRERLVGLAGLPRFFREDQADYHLQAVSNLVSAARLEQRRDGDEEVKRGISFAVEQAVRILPDAIIPQISWQGVKLRGVNFSAPKRRRDLSGMDLRDFDIEGAVFSRCDLSNANMENAKLKGAKLDGTDLRGAYLRFADLAGASLVDADLRGAVLHAIGVEGLDLKGARLEGASFDPDEIPWERIENWREAKFDEGLLDRLIERYGPAPSDARVLMLMWEIPPLVAGGTWTACYHLVKNLRLRGTDVTVVVPWDSEHVRVNPFGSDVTVVPLGIVPPRVAVSSYGAAGFEAWSPYGSSYSWLARPAGAFSPYGGVPYSPYGEWSNPYASISAYGYIDDVGLASPGASTLLRLTEELRRRLLQFVRPEGFDVIHAHDWVTFGAADALARRHRKPWVAHFHSTEFDRRPSRPDYIIAPIEAQGAQANRVVVPSEATAQRVVTSYQVDRSKVVIVPNPLSRAHISPLEMGRFERKQVVFLGRLSAQKGPDLFVAVAEKLRQRRPEVRFVMYGDGEERQRLEGRSWIVEVRRAIEWDRRGEAFAGASAVLVPSRSEPFGMVILEAMQHRVPVLYPNTAGAAEVLKSGITVRTGDIDDMAARLEQVLNDWRTWEETVESQSREIAEYPDRGYERQLIDLWLALRAAPAPTP